MTTYRALKFILLAGLLGAPNIAAGQTAYERNIQSTAKPIESLIWIPREGTANGMLTRICRPRQSKPARLVVISHGSPALAADRAKRKPSRCGEVARFFVARGYAVAFPLRRGYGETGGAWAETYGKCNAADFMAGGNATADDIEVAIEGLLQLPFIAQQPAIVIGQSAGGWGALVLASRNPTSVAAFINIAGGRGARKLADGSYSNCSPQRLIASFAELGRISHKASLWIYAKNDRLFGPNLSRRLHAAYTSAGGEARFELLAPFGVDGHNLFFARGGSLIWGPIVERWLAWPDVQ